MQYLTAYGALIWLGQVAKGDFVVITAASSSVGIAAIEMVKVEGATSIAVTRTAAKKASLLKLGADHVIVTDEEDLVARVHEITSGKGARVVFDPIGGTILESLAAATAPKGIIFEYGALAPEPTPYPLFHCTRQVPYHSGLHALRADTRSGIPQGKAIYLRPSRFGCI